MPRRDDSGETKGFLAAWRAQLPNVAASLTTALILFLVSLSFAPVRHWLFASEVAAYPLICTADPVAAPGGRRIVEFYIVNRSADNFTEEQLQETLEAALRGSGSAASATITLPLIGGEGRIARVMPDADFNRDKGELVAWIEGETVRLRVARIQGGAILRVYILLTGMADVGPISRDAKVAVPFDYQAMREPCYTRT